MKMAVLYSSTYISKMSIKVSSTCSEHYTTSFIAHELQLLYNKALL